jgi:hypothetical protein
MNGKAFYSHRVRSLNGFRLPGSKLDYVEIREIVNQGIAKGLIIQPENKVRNTSTVGVNNIHKGIVRGTPSFCVRCDKPFNKCNNKALYCESCRYPEVTCKQCGKNFTVKFRKDKIRVNCSYKCSTEALKVNRKGKNPKAAYEKIND